MIDAKKYDTCIIGGGLAGLSLSIQLAKLGYTVALFEKEQYPFHKVCGEYISLESWDFIEHLGYQLSSLNLPQIKKLIVSSPDGKQLQQQLPLGGFGISRFKIDAGLKDIALASDVDVFENCKVTAVELLHEEFKLQTTTGEFACRVCCGSFGKRSNLDVKWNRSFTGNKNNKLNNYIGVKYHVKTSQQPDTIALHNFKNGYCGISKIEDDKYCLCYLTNADNLKKNNNSIEDMERNILRQNPHLENIFKSSKILYDQPVTISQISFDKKTQVENHILMIGDAAGMITPLCGNGMSMALHSSKIATKHIHDFLQGKINRQVLERNYSTEWKNNFAKRLRTGRIIQSMFGKIWPTNIFVAVLKRIPFITRWLIKQTHGKPF